jgi:hypothetical protein
MSATLTASSPVAPSSNGQTQSPVDYVRSLSPEAKEEVFAALLLELIEINDGGHGLIPCEFAGHSLGYYVPPKAAQERYERMMAELPPEMREKLRINVPQGFDPDACLSDDELQELNREIDAECLQSQSS